MTNNHSKLTYLSTPRKISNLFNWTIHGIPSWAEQRILGPL